MQRYLFATFFLFACVPLSGSAQDADPIRITDAWIREAPPGAAMLAAYMTIHNDGAQDKVLNGVDSDCFGHVMLHRSVTENGVARMIHADSVRIPAGGSLRLEPGGYHLMMPAPDERLVSGDSAGFRLHFEGGATVEVDAPVRRPDLP
jgi:copper(I)-binding protein